MGNWGYPIRKNEVMSALLITGVWAHLVWKTFEIFMDPPTPRGKYEKMGPKNNRFKTICEHRVCRKTSPKKKHGKSNKKLLGNPP